MLRRLALAVCLAVAACSTAPKPSQEAENRLAVPTDHVIEFIRVYIVTRISPNAELSFKHLGTDAEGMVKLEMYDSHEKVCKITADPLFYPFMVSAELDCKSMGEPL